MPIEERQTSVVVVIKEVFLGMVPLGMLIASTLGSILMGLATPTEAAAVGVAGATFLAVVYRRFTFEGLKSACISRPSGTMPTSTSLTTISHEVWRSSIGTGGPSFGLMKLRTIV